MGTQSAIGRPRWQATALAIAAAVVFGVSASDANALALGRVTVLSALGEPLRAEIDIPEINADEIASLKANIASPDAFKAAGVEYSPALADVRITLERRPDGRHFLRLVSFRAVNEPFVDLILESSWASGRIVRDYTMLFDPPAMRQQQQQPVTAQTAPAPAPQQPAARAPGAAQPSAPAVAGRAAPGGRAAPSAPTARAPSPPGEGKQVTVKDGDTAGKIASANKPATVSLDQMLVAMLRANPDAFMGGNINRLRSGAVLDMPSAEQAALVPTDEAKQTLVAQSKDFNEFRRRLAEGVPTTKVGDAQRQSGGKVTAKVEEKKPTAAAPDKLTLSKGSAQGKGGAEDKIAQQRAQQDAATRVAELNKNIADLNKLGKAPAPGTPAAATTASAAKPGIPVPLGTPAAAGKPASAPAAAAPAPTPPAPAPAAAASAKPAVAEPAKPASAPAPVVAAAPASAPAAAMVASAAAPATTSASAAAAPAASAAVASASAAAPAASVTAAAPASAPAPAAAAKPPAAPAKAEAGFLDDLLENPLILGGIGLLVALAAAFGFYRVQQRKKAAQVDSSFLESRLQPDSFFGASGGQRIDTNEGSVTGSSMVYSPSQLDAAGDVDPVAEADVYLAYGRDLQAEEILKEALRTQPQRVAIHTKLLEIYAKRRDAKAFELIATEAYGLTHGDGPEWTRICELGQELDPSNSLYRPGGAPSETASAAAAAATEGGNFGATQQVAALPVDAPPAPDVDLDLDFSLGDDEPAAAAAPQAAAAAPAAAPAAGGTYDRTQAVEATPEMPALDLNFDAAPAAAPQAAAAPAAATLDAPDLVLDENSLNFDATPAQAPAPAAQAAAAPAPAASAEGMLEFDLGGLSLDLPGAKADEPKAAAAAPAAGPDTETPTTAGAPLSTAGFDDTGSDPLATKLALAQEFNAIGDPDGARTLAQEVIAEASGELKSAAQKFLAEIS
ncbi:FimV/HubP family polar landmark protein [Ramlibacter sp. PS4R-6]|uniref:FimV/HubP family polar landmark protein n=1 Tax=Ramlibacter sp. PS4R-6 TaxID=3133438 RepID=UPI0030B7E204